MFPHFLLLRNILSGGALPYKSAICVPVGRIDGSRVALGPAAPCTASPFGFHLTCLAANSRASQLRRSDGNLRMQEMGQ